MVWEPDWVLSGGWSFLMRLPSSHLLSYFVPGLLLCIWEWDWETWVSWVRLWGAEHPFREIPLNCSPVSCETPLHVPKETRNPDSWVRSSDFENAVTSGGFLAAAVPVQGWRFQTSGFHQRLNTLLLRLIYSPSILWPFPLILSCHNWVVHILGSVFKKCLFAHCLLVPKQLSTSWST